MDNFYWKVFEAENKKFTRIFSNFLTRSTQKLKDIQAALISKPDDLKWKIEF